MKEISACVAPARVNVLGVNVSAIDMNQALGVLTSWIERGEQHYVCITGMHGIMECQRDPGLADIHNAAGLVTPDGMPLVWMAHHLGFPLVRRVYGPDLMHRMTAIAAEAGYSIYLYGATPAVLEKLQRNLLARHPGLRIVGSMSPPFRPLTSQEDEAIVDAINAANPDIVWVGLSTPKQERWMAAHSGRVRASVMVGVGAAFDFLAGVKPQAPRWMQERGLEWLFRMLSEPRRLGGRYLRNIPLFIFLTGRQLVMRSRYPQPGQGQGHLFGS